MQAKYSGRRSHDRRRRSECRTWRKWCNRSSSRKSWTRAGGGGTVQAAANSLTVAQSPRVQQEDRRAARSVTLSRGKTPQSSQATLASDLRPGTHEARHADHDELSSGRAALAVVLARLETLADVTLTIDAAALAEQGTSGTTPVGVAADKHPLAQVLTALCEPRGWAWRIIDGGTFEITTQDALRNRAYLEVYDLRPLLTDGARPNRCSRDSRHKPSRPAGLRPAESASLYSTQSSGRAFIRQHQAGHQRIEQFVADAIAASAAPVRPLRPLLTDVPKPTSTPPKSPQP